MNDLDFRDKEFEDMENKVKDAHELAYLQEGTLIGILELLKTVRFWYDKGLDRATITEMLIKTMDEEDIFTPDTAEDLNTLINSKKRN